MDSFDSFDSFRQEGLVRAARDGRPEAPHDWRPMLRFLRQAFIVVAILVFLVYCRASVVYQNQVDVPDYRTVSVDLLGGKTRQQWDADSGSQFSRLMQLENKRYQLPLGAEATVTGKDGKPTAISPEKPLTSDDFAAFIAKAPAGAGVVMELRDTSAIYELVGLDYLLRDAIYNPERPEDAPLVNFAEPVTKELIDKLHQMGVKVITVTGEGSPVGYDAGTSLMVALIFLCLVAALKPILWDPFQAMLDKRQKELAMGAEAARHNQTEAAKLEEDRADRNAKLMRDIQAKRMQEQQRTAKEVEAVIQSARDEEKAARHRELQDINSAARETEAGVQTDIPKLAEAIAEAVLGRERGK